MTGDPPLRPISRAPPRCKMTAPSGLGLREVPMLTPQTLGCTLTREQRFAGRTMKLFYLPGSCALGAHIALEHFGLAYEAVRVERGRQTDPTYLAVNPLGRVPALVTATHGTITEAPVVLSYIADV